MHWLNKITKKDCYPLPLIDDLLDAPWKARMYTKIDLQHTYHLICIAKGDKQKTTFQTHNRPYEWCVMPFGLTNAPAAFKHFMNDIFADLLDVCTMIYLDDILIYSSSMSDHMLHVQEALQHLWDNRLYTSAEKCEFHTTSMEYLGFILCPDSLMMDPTKIQVIQDWPKPHKVWDIQSFLGFTNLYQQFIYNYSNIVIPLTSPGKELCGTSLTNAGMLSMLSRRHLLALWWSLTGFQMCRSQLKWMPWTTLLQLSSPSLSPMEKSTLLHFTCELWQPLN